MTTKQPDGGPAFPVEGMELAESIGMIRNLHLGMSLRDWFAGQALEGELASQSPGNEWIDGTKSLNSLAKRCGRIADAMLKERDA